MTDVEEEVVMEEEQDEERADDAAESQLQSTAELVSLVSRVFYTMSALALLSPEHRVLSRARATFFTWYRRFSSAKEMRLYMRTLRRRQNTPS